MSYKALSLWYTYWQWHGYHLYSGNPRRFCSSVTTSKRLMLHTRPNWMPFSSTDRVMLRLILPIEGDCRLWNRSARFISIKVRVRNWVRRSDDFFLGPKKKRCPICPVACPLSKCIQSREDLLWRSMYTYHVFDCGDLDTDRLQGMSITIGNWVTCHESIRARIATSEKNLNLIIMSEKEKEKNRA